MNFYIRRILFYAVIVAIGIGLVGLQPPSQSAQSEVVFSNMPDSFTVGASINGLFSGTIVFDVPVGSDYQINSIQIVVRNPRISSKSLTARIHAEGGGKPGDVIVELGTKVVPQGNNIPLTFTPSGYGTLRNGGRYWLVLSSPTQLYEGIFWYISHRPPTGVFSFVEHGEVFGGSFVPAFSNDTSRNIIIDADPTDGTFIDSRENSIEVHPYQTAAIYCQADGIDVYGIEGGAGWLAFHATQAEIDAVGISSENTLIKASEDGTIRLYRLSTGEFQVNSPIFDRIRGNLPDGYVFIFEGCS